MASPLGMKRSRFSLWSSFVHHRTIGIVEAGVEQPIGIARIVRIVAESCGSCQPVGPGPSVRCRDGPEPGTIDDRKPTRPARTSSAKPPVNGSSYSGETQSVYWLNSQYAWQSLCCRQL